MDVSITLVRPLIALCAATSVAGVAAWYRMGRGRLARVTDGLGVSCLVLALAAWLTRWWLAGHLPLFGSYESGLSLGVAILLAALVARTRIRTPAGIWPAACAATAALLAHGLSFDPTPYPLTISERSWVVDIHALLAWAAFGALVANACLAVHLLLVKQGFSANKNRRLVFSLSLGFLLHSAMLASGSFYKFLLFGTAWDFDPIETLGFLVWVCYGTLLHLHLFAGWAGRRLARWCLLVFLLLVLSYRGIVYFPAWSTYHIFDMDLRMHLTGAETSRGGDQ